MLLMLLKFFYTQFNPSAYNIKNAQLNKRWFTSFSKHKNKVGIKSYALKMLFFQGIVFANENL